MKLKTFGGLALVVETGPVRGAGTQRRRLALLALLDWAGDRGMTREKILGYLWPESDSEKARRILNQAIYTLRRDLGADDLFTGSHEIRLNPERLWSDRGEFCQRYRSGDLEEAVALYQGPYLDGFYLPEAPEFERWTETTRATLAQEYAEALERLARGAGERGDLRAAVGWWRKLANAEPLSSRVALGLMQSLAAAGDMAGALQCFRVHEELVRQELEAPPDRDVVAFAEGLRRGRAQLTGRPAGRTDPAPPSGLPPSPAAPIPPSRTPSTRVPAPEPKARNPVPEPGLSEITDEYARPRPAPEPASAPSAGARAPLASPASIPPKSAASSRRRLALRWLAGAGAAVVLLGLGLGGRFRRAPAATGSPTVAVGWIVDFTGDSAGLARALREMLATNLTRARGVQVVSTARLYELMGPLGGASDSAARVVAAARQAGAAELVDGALYRVQSRYLLDLRRTDLATGRLRASYRVEGESSLRLADSGAAALAQGLGGEPPGAPPGGPETRSVVAYRLYEQGLREYFAGRPESAASLFDAALREDSSFAMAAFYRALTVPVSGGDGVSQRLAALGQVVRLAANAPDRDRLVILGRYYLESSDPRAAAVAETLTVRYPAEVEGYNLLSNALLLRGDFAPAIAALQRVIAMDSATLRKDPRRPDSPARCLACEAAGNLAWVYRVLDSTDAAERVAREWTRVQPGSPSAWGTLAMVLQAQGRWEEALAAENAVAALSPQPSRAVNRAITLFLAGRFDEADALLQEFVRIYPVHTSGTLWWAVRSLRMQGRLREALEAALRLRRLAPQPPRRDAAPYEALMQGAVLYEMGRFREAAALFDSISRHLRPGDMPEPRYYRSLAWTQTLRASALAAAGDTALLPRIADSVEGWAARTGLGRDHRLPHHVRGLILVARGRLPEAEAAFRRALLAPAGGYTRTNVQLAQVLLAQGRPLEAARIARAPLWNSFDGPESYVTPTELCELTALAFDAAGLRDSAAAYYRRVVTNWRRADPELVPRRERAALRLRALEASR
ncbi:MAG TPA: tetratricopeptide repeat protein [Gemmatimonadales bacterium]|nr:tetratricopeptide repeat protein [Gemmatimonadales bacterium]